MGWRYRLQVFSGATAVSLAAALLTTPAQAGVPWNRGAVIVPPGTHAERPQVAVDSRGDRHVVYYDQHGDVSLVEVNTFGLVERPVKLFESDDAHGGYPRIAIDDEDRVTVVWYVVDPEQNHRSHVAARTVSADGELGETQVLSDPADNAYYPEVVVDSTGVATVAWENEMGGGWPGRIQAVRLAPGTGEPLGPVVDLDDPGGELPNGIGVGDLSLAIDDEDRVTAAWMRADGDPRPPASAEDPRVVRHATIRAVRISADGVPGETQHVSDDPTVDFRYPQIAIAPDGTATIVYTSFGEVAGTVATRLSAVDGTPGTPMLVSDPEVNSLDDPVATVDGKGRVTIAWYSYGRRANQLETRRIAAGGELEAERPPVGPKGVTIGRMEMIAIASDPGGRVFLLWPGADGPGGRETRMHAVRLSAGDGTPSTTHRMSSPDGFMAFDEVIDLTVDSRRRASAVWSRDGAVALRRSYSPRAGLLAAGSTILSGPDNGKVISDRTPTFTFEASTVEATFECRVDERKWRACSSPMSTPKLTQGRHRFEVRAVDADGTGPDRTPAVARFQVR